MNKKLFFAVLLSVAPFAYGMKGGDKVDIKLAEEIEEGAGFINSIKNKFNAYDSSFRNWCDKKIVEKLAEKLGWEDEDVTKYLKWIAGGGLGIAGLVTLRSAYNDRFEDEDEETYNQRAFVKALLGLGLIGSGAYVVFSTGESVGEEFLPDL